MKTYRVTIFYKIFIVVILLVLAFAYFNVDLFSSAATQMVSIHNKSTKSIHILLFLFVELFFVFGFIDACCTKIILGSENLQLINDYKFFAITSIVEWNKINKLIVTSFIYPWLTVLVIDAPVSFCIGKSKKITNSMNIVLMFYPWNLIIDILERVSPEVKVDLDYCPMVKKRIDKWGKSRNLGKIGTDTN